MGVWQREAGRWLRGANGACLMRSSGPSENVGELHAPRQLHMCMLLQSRRTPALPHLATVHVRVPRFRSRESFSLGLPTCPRFSSRGCGRFLYAHYRNSNSTWSDRPRCVWPVLRGVMAIFVNAKHTQTTALRVRTGLTEHTCKGLGPVDAPTPRYTHDCARIFPFLAMLATSSAPVH